jgi:predicted glycogen debranching enzyme
VIHPDGHLSLKEFWRDPFPVFVYDLDGAELEKTVLMVHGENTTVIEYEWKGEGECVLEVRPLLAFRDYHSTTHENGAIHAALELEPGCVTMSPYQGCPNLSLAHNAVNVAPEGHWYRNFEYTIEQERGLDFREDLFNPLVLRFALNGHSRATVIASTEKRGAENASQLRAAELERRKSIGAGRDPFERALFLAADQFIVKRGEGSTVIAGYHWFSDWGRDTMIALPGLTLATGRYDEARGILLAFADSVDRGMLPNRFPDAGEIPEYNTVDATLWFFEAVRAYAAHTGDDDFVRTHLYPVLAGIIAWHERGTRYGIRLHSDGLLLAGEPGVQLTWMDAKVGDWVVTPRYGKPVEIQALWYNALRVMEDLSGEAKYREMADRARNSFRRLFWNDAAGCLYDAVNGDQRDASIRPNQILAVSLHYSMLTGEQAKAVVAAVERQLLTPYGLRSLAPGDPQYRGRYEGDPYSRDSAYHQGTVWPWLIGPFITAYLKVNGRSAKARKQAEQWLSPLRRFLLEQGGGQVPEVFDGDAPHRAGGCMAQAWSVAELLRVCVEELPAAKPARRIAAIAS